ncbi:formate dehydrogenase subunit gamma [Ferrimonas senticii]|uniref:formate dehydrogenase subunit gamma n=1 Tax=Ferrimonas senticii TaxID=394566 RepID=UPI000420B0AA|nr:formate dehydrogenase subunit gamma [Ferrimonas senticii]
MRATITSALLLGFVLAIMALAVSPPALAKASEAEQQAQAKALQAAQLAEIDKATAPEVPLIRSAQAAEEMISNQSNAEGLSPLWTAVREGQTGRTTSKSPFADSFINQYDFMLIEQRPGWLSKALTFSLFGMIVVFAVFVLVNGASKLEKGFSGVEVRRWSNVDIWVHWLMAIPCILLILTGLALLAGRWVFADWLGPQGLATLAAMAKPIHDYMALPFALFGVIAMLRWMKHNIPAGYDLKWFTVVGGYLNFGPFKGQHPDAGFSNAGEKLWYWSFTLFGLAIIVSGMFLLFPEALSTSRTDALWALLIHASAAIVITGFTVVHIFMATVLSEGGMVNMVTGYCDENWAKQHHNVWYDEIKADGSIEYKTS